MPQIRISLVQAILTFLVLNENPDQKTNDKFHGTYLVVENSGFVKNM